MDKVEKMDQKSQDFLRVLFNEMPIPQNLILSVIDLNDPANQPEETRSSGGQRDFERDREAILRRQEETNEWPQNVILISDAKPQTQNRDRERSPVRDGKLTCTICLEKFESRPLCSTTCGHVFCTQCLEDCLKHEKKCPNCRAPIKSKKAYHQIFL